MKDYKSLNHTRWDCKYHIVFIPKQRKKIIYGRLRKYLGDIFHQLAKQRQSEIIEGHMHVDHIHICIQIPPKYAVCQVVGYIGCLCTVNGKKNQPAVTVVGLLTGM